MDIIVRKGIDVHWWGESILLFDKLTDFYVCTPIETLLLKYLAISNNINNSVEAISNDYGMDKDDVLGFIEIFLDNFSHFFQTCPHAYSEKIQISGKEGMFYPLELHISLTNACFHHCIHCYKSAQHNGVYLDTDILNAFLDTMSGYTPYLTLSGGDPILHPSFINLLDEYGSKYHISVLTSGYRVNETTIRSLKKATLGVTVSIYSSEAEKHDSFVGVDGSYDSIKAFLLAAKKNCIPVGVSTILTNENYADIEKLILYLEKFGITSCSIGRVAPIGRASLGNLKNNIPNRNQFISEVNNLSKNHPSVSIWPEDSHFSTEIYSGFRCTAGSFIWAIYENGEIHPCAACTTPELKIGDISCFDDTILRNRGMYEKRIAKLPYLQLSEEHPCPFTD